MPLWAISTPSQWESVGSLLWSEGRPDGWGSSSLRPYCLSLGQFMFIMTIAIDNTYLTDTGVACVFVYLCVSQSACVCVKMWGNIVCNTSFGTSDGYLLHIHNIQINSILNEQLLIQPQPYLHHFSTIAEVCRRTLKRLPMNSTLPLHKNILVIRGCSYIT